MAFVSYNPKEDMQDDTYKVITQLIIQCVNCDLEKDVEGFYRLLRALYLLIWQRIPKEQSEAIDASLRMINDSLYSTGQDHGSTEERSIIFDTCEECFKQITGVLDKQGILFRMRADLDSLVAQ